MQDEKANAHGIKWGLIIGLVYAVMLLLRYTTGATSIIMFTLWTFLGYIIVLILLLVAAFQLRKTLGGYVELKLAFKSLFIAVLIFELVYVVFTFVYLKLVNPDFYLQLRDATEALLEKTKQSEAQTRKMLENFDVDIPRKMNFLDALKTYLSWVAISGIFAFLFALIVKKKREPFQDQDDNFFQHQP